MTDEVVMEDVMSNTEDSQKFSILVVDDAPENVMLLGLILEELGDVSSALGGREAIDKALENRPDLIVLDIQMPEVNGYDVIEALKADPRTESVPVIFVTGLSEETDEEKGLELGAIDYITKPYNPLVVTARVRNHLRVSGAGLTPWADDERTGATRDQGSADFCLQPVVFHLQTGGRTGARTQQQAYVIVASDRRRSLQEHQLHLWSGCRRYCACASCNTR